MPDQTAIDRYLDDVDSYLHVDRAQRERILAEIQGHLHDALEAHTTQGARPEEAMRRAMADLGPPQDVASQFAPAPTPFRAVRGWRRWTPMVPPTVLLTLYVAVTAWILYLYRGGLSYTAQQNLLRLLPYAAVLGVLTIATHLAIRKGDRDPAWRRAAWLFAVLTVAIYVMSIAL